MTPQERRENLGYECSCHVFTDPKESLCRFCLPRREEWEDEKAREQAELDLEADVHREERYEFVYEPPRTPQGDVDYRKEVEWWKRERAESDCLTMYPIDSLILIDNLLIAIDGARKERDKERANTAMERLARLDEELGLQ